MLSSKYPLADLLRVRVIREDNAMRKVTKIRYKLEQLKTHLENQKKSLQQYHNWRVLEEKKRYDEIMHKDILKKALETLKAQMAIYRDEELAREKSVLDAEIAVEQAQKDLQSARLVHAESVKSKQKMQEHKDLWMIQAQKNEEYLLDKELEDVKLVIEHHEFESIFSNA